MITELTITDITNMHAGRICVAGVNDQHQSIRLLLSNRSMFKEWCWCNDQIIIPFTRIRINLVRNTPNPPHTEDWLIDDTKLSVSGVTPPQDKQNFLKSILDPDVQSIFGTTIKHREGEGFFITSGEGNRSLGTVKAYSLSHFSNECYEGRRDYRVSFADSARKWYRLKIVDLSFQTYIDHLREKLESSEEVAKNIDRFFHSSITYLRIGLARGWGNYPDRCHLQITGVYTFPDYLRGKCFADFIRPESEDKI